LQQPTKINLHSASQQCVAYHLPDLTLAMIHMRSRFGAVCMALPIKLIPKVVFCSCATTRPAGQGRYRRIARVARKPCASPERRDVSTVYPICTYLNAERARCPIPRKVRRQAKLKIKTEIGSWYLDEFGNPTREIKGRG
jgi:hypothetical protein